MRKNIHDRHDDFPDDDGESIEEESRIRSEGRVGHEGEDDEEEVRDGKNTSHDYENYHHPLGNASEVYGDTCEEQKNRRVEEYREERDGGVNFQPLGRHEPDVSLAGTKKAENRICTAGVLSEPAFTDNRTEAGTETGEEASEPETIECDRRIRGPLGDGWVRDLCWTWVAAIQQLMEEYGRLSLIIRI